MASTKPGAIHTSRGDGREDIYLSDADRMAWLEVLGQVCTRFNWVCHAWCQMTNHYHILIETPEANLAQGMRQLNGVYTQRFNRAHSRAGHVFQGRYKAILVERDSYLLELARYVVLNPLRARMVRRLEKWAWSSYPATCGQAPAPEWLQTDWILAHRPIKSVGPAVAADGGRATVTCTEYDTLGNPVELWAGSTLNPSAPCDMSGADPDLKLQTSVVYNDLGWKVKETDPLGKVWTWTYDRHGNVVEATDAKNQKTQLTWAYGHQLLARTVRDANGNVYKTEGFIRNALGQPTRVEVKDGNGKLIVAQETAFDAAHRVTRTTDLRPRTLPRTRTYDWSPGGMLNTMQDHTGARTDYLYDPVGNLIGIWGPNFDYLAFTHDAGGRLTEKWHANGINSRYEWNADSTLAGVANRVAYDDAHVVSHHEYVYDGLGRRQTSLDKAGTLTLPAINDSYGYDALDNRTRRTVDGVDQYAIHDAANQLVELRSGSPEGALTHAFVYDANGNLVRKCEGGTVIRTETTCSGSTVSSFTWNPDDQLIAFSKPGINESYQYDHLGRRIAKTSNGVATYYRYNGDDIDAEYSASWSETARWVHGPGTDDPLMRLTGQTNDPSATAIYYHQDGINSVVAASNQAGSIAGAQLFDAWGNKVQSSGTIAQYGYTGREPDQSGMIYYRARYYDPSIGRFISRDPIGLQGGLNQYSYVGNNPVNFTDPEGLCPTCFWGGVAGFVGGVITGSTQDGLRGAIIGGVTGAAAGFVVGSFNPALAKKAGSLVAGAVTGFAANLLQQKATSTVYKTVGLPGQAKAISVKQAIGSALGTSGGQALVKLAPKAGAAVGNAVTSLLSPTAKVAPAITKTATTTTTGKVASALYEGGTSAYGELVADSFAASPAPASHPSAGNQSMSVFAAPSLSTGCLLCGGSPNYSSGGITSLPSKFSF